MRYCLGRSCRTVPPTTARASLRRTRLVATSILVVLVALAFVGCGCSEDQSAVKVPDVTGMAALDAIHTLQAQGLMLGDVANSPDPELPALTVLSQTPAAGQQVDPGSVVALTVSSGSQLVATPDVTGMTTERAVSELENLGLTAYKTTAYDDTVPKDTVIGQLPEAGTGVALGASVGILVSRGAAPEKVDVPKVVDQTQTAAVSAIEKAGLKANSIAVYSSSTKAGVIVGQSPAGGSKASPGSTVDILVSQGSIPSFKTVPNVVGKSRSAAVNAITSAGLTASAQEQYSDTVAAGIVIAQYPSAATKVAPGADIGIMVSKGPEQVQPPGPETAKVPAVTGMTQDAAAEKLEKNGFTVKVVDVPTADSSPGTVVQQFPAAGATVLKGSDVLIGVARALPAPY
jgi:beta-lactam-binding protein with PASTA domain